MEKQKTIAKSFQLSGVGLHTGQNVKIEVHPANANHGIVFVRKDIPGNPAVSANVINVISTNRSTCLGNGEAHVSTVEHLLSACAGMKIDNLLIDVYGPEIPIMNGSAEPFVTQFEKSRIVDQEEEKEVFILEKSITYRDEDSGAELVALPSDNFQITTLIDFDSDLIHKQYYKYSHQDDYANEIAPARTFVFLREIESLIDQNLIKGGDLDNAIVFVDKVLEKEQQEKLAKRLNKPTITVEKEGYLNTTKLKFKNEPARHKLLDLLGDLNLIGIDIQAKILATKPGHKVNVEFAKMLKRAYVEHKKILGKPKYDPNKKPIMDATTVAKYLPHRYPFLLVDKIIELSDTHVVGIKNVTHNEQFFTGHFPNNPIFPGVLQLEALAQTGGILALSLQDDPFGWDTYFLKMDQVKFKQKVVPGDTLILKLELLNPIRRGMVQMHGTTYVGNKIVSEGILLAQIVKQK